MILPKKHLSISESYFGFGAFLLDKLEEPSTVEALWSYYQEAYAAKQYPVKFSFDQFASVLGYLFMIGAIQQNEEGMISYEIT